MKRTITIFCGLIGIFFTPDVLAQKPTCEGNSYSSEVLKEEKISETCTAYEIEVSYDGARAFGLSHYSIGLPCGEVKDISNSEGWNNCDQKGMH